MRCGQAHCLSIKISLFCVPLLKTLNLKYFALNKWLDLSNHKSCHWSQVFLKSDRVSRMVQSGGCSASDSREVFKKHIEKRVRSLPEIDGLSKETVLSSWIAKFDTIYRGEEDPRKHQQRMTASAASELILSKDQLYEMFQQILGIKKFEHQLLYNACQVSLIRAKWVGTITTLICCATLPTSSFSRDDILIPITDIVFLSGK